MTNSVTFPSAIGGDESTYTDDNDASTGMGAGGHRTRFIPSLSNFINVAQFINDLIEDMLDEGQYSGTSATSNSVGTGSKTFTTQSGKVWTTGTPLRISDSADPGTNYMRGTVTSYSSTTLVVNVSSTGGSGTITSWSIGMDAAGAAVTDLSVGTVSTGQLVANIDGAIAGTNFPSGALVYAHRHFGGF
jgi:hypothetical protein